MAVLETAVLDAGVPHHRAGIGPDVREIARHESMKNTF